MSFRGLIQRSNNYLIISRSSVHLRPSSSFTLCRFSHRKQPRPARPPSPPEHHLLFQDRRCADTIAVNTRATRRNTSLTRTTASLPLHPRKMSVFPTINSIRLQENIVIQIQFHNEVIISAVFLSKQPRPSTPLPVVHTRSSRGPETIPPDELKPATSHAASTHTHCPSLYHWKTCALP